MAFLAPLMAISAGMSLFEGMKNSKKANAAANNQNQLAGQMAGQYNQYMPQVTSSLWNMTQGDNPWSTSQYNSQRSDLYRGAQNSAQQMLRQLQGNGMMQSGQANNMMAGMAMGQGQQLAGIRGQIGQQDDARKQALLQLLGGMVGNQGNAASSIYGNVGNQYQGAANQSFNALGSLAGAYGGMK